MSTMLPSGLSLQEGFIFSDAQETLLDFVRFEFQALPARKNKAARSRVLRFGWSYEAVPKRLPAWPSWLETLRASLPVESPFALCAITLNEYPPGHSIARHVDSAAFGEPVQIVSLGGEAVLRLSRDADAVDHTLPTGSLCTLSGDARWLWQHEVLPVEQVRYSIVFRQLAERGDK